MPALLLAIAALPAGFAVAEVTGVRSAGGAVLAALAVAAVLSARAPAARSAAWLAVLAIVFALSHVVAGALGTWAAVAAAATVAGLAADRLLLRSSSAPSA